MTRTNPVRRRTRAATALVVGATIAMTFVAPGAANAAPARYAVTTVPLQAVALNETGVVAGNVTRDGVSRAATWAKGRLRVLRLPAGATSAVASDLNDSGLVGGTAIIDGRGHAVIWEGGRPTLLPEPPPLLEGDPVDSQVTAVNDRGDVVGSVYREPLGWRAISWPADQTSTSSRARGYLLTSSDANTTDLNNSGVAVGIGESGRRAVQWSALGRPTPALQPLRPDQVIVSGAQSVNDAGFVVGAELDELPEGGGAYSAVLWGPDGVPTTLPQPTSDGGALPGEINGRGQIAGEYAGQVVLWSDGRVRLLGVSGYPVGLNDAGTILVRSGDSSSLLTPGRRTSSAAIDWRRPVWGRWAHVQASLQGARKAAWQRWWSRH